MTADAAAWVGVSLTAMAMIGGGLLWLFRTGIKPLKIVIENNTAALSLALTTLSKHEDKIDDHEIRINTIETTHSILGCAKDKM